MKKNLLLLSLSLLFYALPNLSKGQGLVKDLCDGVSASFPSNIVDVNGTTFFVSHCGDPSLWKTDGTTAGTVLVKQFAQAGAGLFGLTNVNGTLFGAETKDNGQELWKSDGTSGGTVIVKDINSGTDDGLNAPSFLGAVLNNKIYFSANNGTEEVWVSDGTDAGTMMFKDVNTTSKGASSYSNKFTTLNNTIYFVADDGIHAHELWKTDGTSEGTMLVKDINTNKFASAFDFTSAADRWTRILVLNGVMYFSAADDQYSNSYKLWKSDGTAAGTVKIAASPLRPENITKVNNNLFFNTSNSNVGNLWKSDGTEAGTVIVKKDLIFYSLGAANGLCFFYGQNLKDDPNGNELWKSDGTLAGTTLVKDINPGANSSDINYMAECNNKLYFAAFNPTHGSELWVSDGTDGGTSIAAETGEGDLEGKPSHMTNINGVLYFSAFDSKHGQELWKLGTLTGVNHAVDTESINIFPNPTNGFITLKGLDNMNEALLGISIYNLSGVKVKEFSNTSSDMVQADLSTLQTGMYVVKLNFASQSFIKRINVTK